MPNSISSLKYLNIFTMRGKHKRIENPKAIQTVGFFFHVRNCIIILRVSDWILHLILITLATECLLAWTETQF